MTDPHAPYRRHCATCGELDLLGDGDDLDDDGDCMSCAEEKRDPDDDFDREAFDAMARDVREMQS